MDPLRIYLLAGLVGHKLLWEVMKRRKPSGGARARQETLTSRLVKLLKVGILLGLVAQVFLPEILPISGASDAPRTAGVVLFTLGLASAVVGRIQLGSSWSDIEDAGVLPSQALVTQGIYRYVRHPIYAGDLLLLGGFELALNSWLVLPVLILVPAVVARAVHEEKMLEKSLPGYEEYCRRTKRFIPFIV